MSTGREKSDYEDEDENYGLLEDLEEEDYDYDDDDEESDFRKTDAHSSV